MLDGSIAHFEVTFDAVYYDGYEDRDRGAQPVVGSVKECWQRALRDVVGYRITGFGPVATTPGRWGALHAVELTFANGQIIQLPGEIGLHGPDRQRANDFHAALRRACALWPCVTESLRVPPALRPTVVPEAGR